MTSSVCICTYNGAAYIGEQLNSIIMQSKTPNEVIISDDNSMDDTVIIAEAILKNSGINYKIIKNKNNLGYSRNFERCMEYSIGDVIFLCDQDDVWHKDKITLTMTEFENDEKCVMVYHDSRLIDDQNNVLSESAWNELDLKKDGFRGKETSAEVYRNILMYRWLVYGNSLAIKRNILSIFPVPDINEELNGKSWTHDSWIAINSWYLGNVHFLDEKLIDYRQHGNNQTGIKCMPLTDKEKTINRVQRVLFYLKAHRLRLQIFLDNVRNRLCDDDIAYIQSFIDLFEKNESYENSKSVIKFILLVKYYIFGTFKMCNIKRREILTYIIYHIFK